MSADLTFAHVRGRPYMKIERHQKCHVWLKGLQLRLVFQSLLDSGDWRREVGLDVN